MHRIAWISLRQSACTFFGVAMLIAACMPAQSQVNNEKYQGLFLVGEFGEVCTMCEIIVLCENVAAPPAREAIPVNGNFTIYHLQTRSFWSQITTIWEWFIANFSAESLAQGHERPVWIYTSTDDGWSGPAIVDAWIALEPPLLTFGNMTIDRTDQAWFNAADAAPAGYCQRLPLWDSLEKINPQSNGAATP